MPAPDKLLATLARAVQNVRATPGRTGRLVRVPAGAADVLVAGDLHGQVETFKLLFQHADLTRQPNRHLVLQELVHGPHRYPDGSDKSHQLVDLYAALACQFPGRVHYLPGNHELAQATGRPVGKGDEGDLNVLFRKGVDAAYGAAGAAVYALYLELFRACPLAVRFGNGLFLSHSLPNARALPEWDAAKLERDDHPEVDAAPGGFVYSLVWGRDVSEANATNFLAKVNAEWLVSGHVPTDDGFAVPNGRQLIVDAARRPAGFALLPADRPLTAEGLRAGVRVV